MTWQQPTFRDIPNLLQTPGVEHVKSDPSVSRKATDYAHRLIAEYASRLGESLKLFKPLPASEGFFRSKVWQRLLVGSNRSGKTLCASVEAARVVTGQDPHQKFRATDGRIMCVGFDEDHIADVQWRKLYVPGAFPIIRDPETGLWRAVTYDPTDFRKLLPYDAEHRKDWKLAPPLIPPRLIKRIAWKQKNKNLPDTVYLKNGWEMLWFSSKAHPKAGIDADFLWIDEEIQNEDWYHEGLPRLLDRSGKLMWSATPQRSTEVFYHVQEKAKEEPANFAEFVIKIADNPFIPEEEKERWRSSFLTEEERQMRFEGVNVYAGLRVYPEFNPQGMHGIPAFTIPKDWQCYLALDPGTSVAAVLVTALHPDGKEIHAWGEIYVRRHTADQLAEKVKEYVGDREFEDFIIDMHAGGQRPMGFEERVIDIYEHAFYKYGLTSRMRGCSFVPGLDDIEARTLKLKEWLRPIDGKPHFLVHRGACPNLEREMKLQRFKKNRPTDRERVNDSHLVHCLEYTAGYAPVTVTRTHDDIPAMPPVVAAFERKMQRLAQHGRAPSISLGPVQGSRRTV